MATSSKKRRVIVGEENEEKATDPKINSDSESSDDEAEGDNFESDDDSDVPELNEVRYHRFYNWVWFGKGAEFGNHIIWRPC